LENYTFIEGKSQGGIVGKFTLAETRGRRDRRGWMRRDRGGFFFIGMGIVFGFRIYYNDAWKKMRMR
jgi:hypothetical protein